MHRTQILLEDWQYEVLKAAAERDGRSISSIVREAVTAFVRGRRRRPSGLHLAEIAGIGNDPETTGRDHDSVLYGPRREGS